MGILFRFGGENVGAVNSGLTLYSGVPLDNTYEHTYTEQNKLKYSAYASPAQPLYYIRPDKNTIRIQHNGNMYVGNLPLYECNYLKFSNNSYEGIDFYCFVTEVKYINDDTAEIDFEIDVMMTWVASGLVTFEQCFVERETTNSDDIGEHILEEPVDIGDYLYSQSLNLPTTTTGFKIVVGVAGAYFPTEQGGKKWQDLPVNFHTEHNGQYLIADSLTRYYFDTSGNSIESNPDFTTIFELFESLRTAGKGEWVKLIYYTPTETRGKTYTLSRGNSIDGYTPKNKKLLTYPYYGLRVNNYEGTTVDYAFELGSNGSLIFSVITSDTDGMASLIPMAYEKGSNNSMVVKSKYPVMSSSASAFDTYIAQLKAQIPADVANIATPAITGALFGSSLGGIGGVAGAAVGAGVGLITYVTKAFAGGEQAKLKGSTPIGNNSGILQLCNDTAQFGFYFQYIRSDYAQAIDDFFTKFGYKVNRLKTPSKYTAGDVSQGGRTLSWHYIKTIGCALAGQAPASAVSKIQSIMDNGVTFWNKPEIGQYTFPSS